MSNLINKAIIAIALTFLSTSAVLADCTVRGYATRIATINDTTFMYLRDRQTSNYYYLGSTKNPNVAAAMYQAYKGKAKILATGSAPACPTITGPGQFLIGDMSIVGLGY